MIAIPIPQDIQRGLYQYLITVMGRSVDGTIVPLFVDYGNQRVFIGAVAASAAPAKFEINSGNLKIVSGGNGIILPNSGATTYYLMAVSETTNTDGSVNPILTLTAQ